MLYICLGLSCLLDSLTESPSKCDETCWQAKTLYSLPLSGNLVNWTNTCERGNHKQIQICFYIHLYHLAIVRVGKHASSKPSLLFS